MRKVQVSGHVAQRLDNLIQNISRMSNEEGGRIPDVHTRSASQGRGEGEEAGAQGFVQTCFLCRSSAAGTTSGRDGQVQPEGRGRSVTWDRVMGRWSRSRSGLLP